MNELTKEASKQTVLEAISRLWYQHRGNQRKSRRTPYKPLKHDFERYTTDVYGSDCEILDDFDWNFMPFKWQGIDLDQFKADCEDIDNE